MDEIKFHPIYSLARDRFDGAGFDLTTLPMQIARLRRLKWRWQELTSSILGRTKDRILRGPGDKLGPLSN